jgi:hypothetical protein
MKPNLLVILIDHLSHRLRNYHAAVRTRLRRELRKRVADAAGL